MQCAHSSIIHINSLLIRDPVSRLLCCYLRVTVAIAGLLSICRLPLSSFNLSSFVCTSMLMKGGCWLLIHDQNSRLPVHVPLLLCCCLHIAITIAIVRLHWCSGCSCCCCYGVLVLLGGKDVLAVLLIEDMLTLLMMLKNCCRSRSAIDVLLPACHNCHCHYHCRIAFRLLLLWCCSCTWREDVGVTKMLIEGVLTLLILIMDCGGARQTRVRLWL